MRWLVTLLGLGSLLVPVTAVARDHHPWQTQRAKAHAHAVTTTTAGLFRGDCSTLHTGAAAQAGGSVTVVAGDTAAVRVTLTGA